MAGENGTDAVYDVVYLDRGQQSTVIASDVDGDIAADVARHEAKARDAARMFSHGSEPPNHGHLVLVVAAASRTAGGTGPR